MTDEKAKPPAHVWWTKFRNGEIGVNGETDGCHKEFFQKMVKELESYSSNPAFIVGVLKQLTWAAEEHGQYQSRMNAKILSAMTKSSNKRKGV